MQDEPKRGILLKNAQGTRYSHNRNTSEFIGPGELVKSTQDDKYFNYQLLRDPNVYLSCEADDVQTLNSTKFSLLEGIKNRGERLQAFKQKLRWGLALREGSNVQVTISGLVSRETRAVVRYKGRVESDPGTVFGVEILVSHTSYQLASYATIPLTCVCQLVYYGYPFLCYAIPFSRTFLQVLPFSCL